MLELVKEYIAELMALELCCKDGHYQASGIDFRQLHELFDTIIEGVDGASLSSMRDDIQEVVFLGRNLPAYSGKEIVTATADIISEPGKNNQELLEEARGLLNTSLETIARLMQKDITQGENDLFASQARELQQRLGFLNRTLS